MNRYVIVSKVNGEAGDFNNEFRKELYNRFKAKSSKLPAHFTIKAPFEYDGDISDLEAAIEKVCQGAAPAAYIIDGYNHFGNRVIYMDVKMSREGRKFHDELIEEMSKVPYIHFTDSDGKDKTFHVSLAPKKIQGMFDELWDYIIRRPCHFNCRFDNVCIFKWEDYTWKLHREFLIK